VSVVVPLGNQFPVGTPLRLTVTLEQLSLAVAMPKTASLTTIPQSVASVAKVIAAGTLRNAGLVLSITVITCLPMT
jgi:uncharacterized membrane protein